VYGVCAGVVIYRVAVRHCGVVYHGALCCVALLCGVSLCVVSQRDM